MKRYSQKGRKTLALGTIAAASLAVTACEAPVPEPMPLPKTPIQFESPTECIAAGYEMNACQDAYKAALSKHEAEAPRYGQQAQCEEEWGPGNCRTTSNGSGGSFFMPFLTGYLLSSALSGNNGGYYNYGGYYGSPIYRSRSGPVQLAPSNGGSIGTGTSVRKVATAPVAAPKPPHVNTRSVSRGGFGGSMGGRSFGG
jgi:uncharacterized protein YgiB involved in biofilm formation